MSSQQSTLQAFTDAAADAIARAIAGVQRDAQRERELRDAEHRARLAEIDSLMVRVRGTERDIESRLASIKDGSPGEPGPPGRPGDRGADADMDLVRSMVNEAVAVAIAALPPAPAGKDADPEQIAEAVAAEVAKIPPAPAGKDADMDVVRSTIEDLVAAIPADRTDYAALDVVALNGAAFVAKNNEPGACPGEGWQMIAAQGKRGAPGPRGDGVKGDRGDPGPAVAAMDVDGEGLLKIRNADGSTIECDLYPLLSQLVR